MEGWTGGKRRFCLTRQTQSGKSDVGNENGVFENLWGGVSDQSKSTVGQPCELALPLLGRAVHLSGNSKK